MLGGSGGEEQGEGLDAGAGYGDGENGKWDLKELLSEDRCEETT
jgi:hypothetical protein